MLLDKSMITIYLTLDRSMTPEGVDNLLKK